MRPHLFYACIVVSTIAINWYYLSLLMKKTSVRQVVLDKWFPLIEGDTLCSWDAHGPLQSPQGDKHWGHLGQRSLLCLPDNPPPSECRRRVLEYGLRFSTEIFGSNREKTFFHENLQSACFILTEISGSSVRDALPGGVNVGRVNVCVTLETSGDAYRFCPRPRAGLSAALAYSIL